MCSLWNLSWTLNNFNVILFFFQCLDIHVHARTYECLRTHIQSFLCFNKTKKKLLVASQKKRYGKSEKKKWISYLLFVCWLFYNLTRHIIYSGWVGWFSHLSIILGLFKSEVSLLFKILHNFKKLMKIIIYHIYPTLPLGQDMTHGQFFLSGV